MSKIHSLGLLLSCCCLLALGSCGYGFTGRGDPPQGVHRLFIGLLENRTTETGIEVLIADQLKNEFIHKYGGTLTQRENAATELSGSISGIKTRTVSRRGALTSLERRMVMTVDVILKDANGDIIRSATGVSATETYPVVSGDQRATEVNKQRALASLSEKIAEAVFHRLTEDF